MPTLRLRGKSPRTSAGSGWLEQVIDRDRPKRVLVDVGGVGAAIYDRLGEMGYAGSRGSDVRFRPKRKRSARSDYCRL
jgi:hypothetical protein